MILKVFSNLADSVMEVGKQRLAQEPGWEECWLSRPEKLRCFSVPARAGGGITECEREEPFTCLCW